MCTCAMTPRFNHSRLVPDMAGTSPFMFGVGWENRELTGGFFLFIEWRKEENIFKLVPICGHRAIKALLLAFFYSQ